MLHSVKTTPNTLLFVKVKNRQIIAKENQTVDRNRKIQWKTGQNRTIYQQFLIKKKVRSKITALFIEL